MTDVITQKRIETDLRAIGINSGDIVNVHSSMKKIGSQVEGGPQAVIQALLNVLGDQGTLIMPVFSKPIEDIDLNVIPSRLGLISETFRQWPGVKRSNDPTHSVAALGKDADQILVDHEYVPPLGVNSPLHKATLQGGKTLHLGTNLNSNSLLHVAESLAGAPYLHIGYDGFHGTHEYMCTDGKLRVKEPTEAPGDSVGFMKVWGNDGVVAARTEGCIGEAPSELYQSLLLLDAVVEFVELDPYSILCDKEYCQLCPQRRMVQVT
ncbi:MAG: AAC(3) family N-acetyltransferase [Planctomycetes bacterium]|nr:AAC(3) family N-acetyltransferase [Planctomycetota bacterium]